MILERVGREPERTESYGTTASHVVDVYEARGEHAGSLVLLHGGFWRVGYDRMHLRTLAAALADDGFDVALPEYRRVGDGLGGGWPGTLHDIIAVLDEVPHLLGTPLGELSVVGHSAGGHLALLAARERAPHRVVSLAGVLDVAAAHTAQLSEGAVAELWGTPEPSAAAISAIDPHQLSLPWCDIALIHGAYDTDVPLAYSERYAARDPRVSLHIVAADHFAPIDPDSPVYPILRSLL